ncbi:MAG: glycosyl transferase family 1 [Elusimicrobia bacterium GWA2_69_24]|nr:MAG: glycosyl transferase family 1 [Elusimicrobia bacterium GWA2_69_24]HBL18215.1 glycogen synthase [Elusimicrobiota bacterium]
MKAVFYTNEYPPNIYGGAGVAVSCLSRELAKLMQVEVRCFGDQDVNTPRLKARGYRPCGEIAKDAAPGVAKALEAVSINLQFCKNNTADVVHCHTWYTNLGGFFTKILHRIPLIITTHSLEPHRPWKREQLGTAYDLSCWIERNALEAADAIIAVSEGMKRDIIDCFGLPPAKVHVIHNGIDIHRFKKTASTDALNTWKVDSKTPYVLFVGRVTRQKGIIHLVDAIEHIDPRAQIVLCAGAPDTKELAAEMAAKVKAIQARRGGVIWIQKMVSIQELTELYSNAAVFCCPSIYEPFGLINLEAMACETAVVASAVGGIKEVVVPGETGFLVPFKPKADGTFNPADPRRFSKDLARNINKLLGDPALARRMGKKGRRRVERFFSWETVAKKTAALYKALVAANRRANH